MTTPTPDNDREQQDAERRKAVALFRYGVIADLIHAERGQRGLYAKMRQKVGKGVGYPRHAAPQSPGRDDAGLAR
jgi:hypothetical protein